MIILLGGLRCQLVVVVSVVFIEFAMHIKCKYVTIYLCKNSLSIVHLFLVDTVIAIVLQTCKGIQFKGDVAIQFD